MPPAGCSIAIMSNGRKCASSARRGGSRRLVEALPRIRRSVDKHLGSGEPTREFALAAVIELVSRSAIRPGSESYAKANGTRGAATLLKSNIVVNGATSRSNSAPRAARAIEKEFRCPRARRRDQRAARQLPGKRLFQYRGDDGACASSRRATSMHSCARSQA